MMSQSALEKIELEHEAAKLFMRLYEKQHARPMRHIWHNEPKKPDVSCYLNEQRLDLEIAHIYGSEAEAMLLLQRDINLKTIAALHELAQLPVHDRLLKALNTVLASKAKKTYHSERVWLVLRNANPLWNRHELEESLNKVTIPSGHAFEQIWLVGDLQGHSGILQLYPNHLVNSDK